MYAVAATPPHPTGGDRSAADARGPDACLAPARVCRGTGGSAMRPAIRRAQPSGLCCDVSSSRSYNLMAAVAWSLSSTHRPVHRCMGGRRERWLGFGVLVRVRTAGAITALTAAFFLAYGLLEPAPPLYSRDVLRAGATGYGSLWTTYGAGMLVGLLAGVPRLARFRPGRVLGALALVYGALLLPLVALHDLSPRRSTASRCSAAPGDPTS